MYHKNKLTKTLYPQPTIIAHSKIKNIILDALFPIFCLACRKEGFWLCEDCLQGIRLLDFQVCPECEDIITKMGLICPACRSRQKSNLDALIAATSYENPAIKQIVHNLKYRFIADISQPLARLVVKALIRSDCPVPDYIVPVPLHPRRLRWRGFNQSLLLGEHISQELTPLMKIEVLDILTRKYFNQPQMKIKNYQTRLQNVKGIFDLKYDVDKKIIENKNILIIDDIATTGATIFECAKTLKENGARKVFSAVVARQSIKK